MEIECAEQCCQSYHDIFLGSKRQSKMKLLDSHEDGYGQGSTTKASSHCTQYKKAQKMKILKKISLCTFISYLLCDRLW